MCSKQVDCYNFDSAFAYFLQRDDALNSFCNWYAEEVVRGTEMFDLWFNSRTNPSPKKSVRQFESQINKIDVAREKRAKDRVKAKTRGSSEAKASPFTKPAIQRKVIEETKVIRLPRANHEQINEVAKQVDPWTVRTQLDTIMISKWIRQAGRFFSSPTVRMPGFKTNLKELKAYAKTAPSKERRAMINDIVGLYEAKKIKNFRTAENVIIRLGQRTKDPRRSERALKEYEQVLAKYQDAEPMTGRLDRETAKKKMKNIMVTMILLREKDEDPKLEAQHAKKEITVNVIAPNLAEKRKIENTAKSDIRKQKKAGNLRQFYIGQFELRLNGEEQIYIESIENKLITRNDNAEDFGKTAKLLVRSNAVFAHLMDSVGNSYLAGFYLMNFFDSETQGNREFIPKKARNRDTEKLAAYYRFTSTELNLDASTFKEAISNQKYVKDECFLNSIYDFYRDNLLRTDKSRNVITRESILKTIGKTEDNVKEGLSIRDVVPFFEKHRLQLRVYDKFYKQVFAYDPPNRNHHNKAMYCMQADGHIYTLNWELDKLSHQDQATEDTDHFKPKVGENYIIKEDAEPQPYRMINDLEDILEIIKGIEPVLDEKGKPIRQVLRMIHREDDLLKLLYDLIGAGYSPGVNFESGRVTALKMEFNHIFCIIETQQLVKSAIDGVVVVESEDVYNNMSRAMTVLNSKLFLQSHLSHYTERDLEVLDSFRTKPICGTLRERGTKEKLIEIDVSKAYTAAFCDIAEIPIFNEFDAFKPYGGEELLPLNLYIVKDFHHPLSTQSHSLIYGKFITEGMSIVAYKQPSFIKKVDYKKLVDELYETKISDDEQHDAYIKKLIANVNIGLLEKGQNRKSVGYLFQDLAECKYHQAQYGGTIHMIQQIKDVSTVVERSDMGLDDDIELCGPTITTKFESHGEPYYVLVLKAEKQLKNGFRYIKELLLQHHNFKLMQAYDQLADAGIPITSVKTDCFTIPAAFEAKARERLTFDTGIGSWRVSKTSDIIFPMEHLHKTMLDDIEIKNLEPQQLDIADEWDVSELCDRFEEHRRVMVRAEFAGCGKSHACKAMEQRGHRVLFVCPTNKLAQNNRESGVTLNSFFGVGMSENPNDKISKFDDTAYDVIVFDEIYFANIRMLARIKKYSEQNPNKIILATGDTNQLETIDLVSDQIDYETYMDHCIDTIFPTGITLQENKRLRTQADKDILRQFKEDIFNEEIGVRRTIKKYFKFTDQIETASNIAYKNSTCEGVAKAVRKMLNKTDDYEVGERLVCRKYLKHNGSKYNVNFEYDITAIEGTTISIQALGETVIRKLKLDHIQKHFIHSYCRTCHSFQGSSISEKITIFDWTMWCASRKWLYTAVTRATELNNVVFFSAPTQEADHAILDKYLDKKVDNYKKQDRDHNRQITPNFVTRDWLKAQFGKVCSDCGDCFRYDIKGGKVEANLTADRIDNSECHHLNNIVPLCITCNQRKSCW